MESIRDLFGGLWGFDDPEDPGVLEALEDAIRNPSDYVLKPQREGGGNNFWGPDMVEVILLNHHPQPCFRPEVLEPSHLTRHSPSCLAAAVFHLYLDRS